MERKAEPKLIHIEGSVFSGKGEGARFTKLPWAISQMEKKFGFTPHPGTLNIRLAEEYRDIKKLLKKAKATEITPEPGYCRGKFFRAYVMDCLEGAVVIPEVEGYPENVLEIVAPINLREKLKLKDGDKVRIKIVLE